MKVLKKEIEGDWAKLTIENEHGSEEVYWAQESSRIFLHDRSAAGAKLVNGEWQGASALGARISNYLFKVQHEMRPMLETIAANRDGKGGLVS
jgi:hypothetical protein